MNRSYLLTLPALLLLIANVQSRPFQPASLDEYRKHEKPESIYKYTNNTGRITYLSSPPERNVPVERIAIERTPTEASIEAARQRHENIMESVQSLSEARMQRERIREERERKRPERQVLLNRAQPPAVYRKEMYLAPPTRRWYRWPGNNHNHDREATERPSRGRTTATFSMPPSSFPHMFSEPAR